ncbi:MULTISPECIES: DGQHR domain-containing protein [unclassified Pedobacter]|uniref:DGQHR domain-containing protein n=1 Tax=unclassified Pedobacter TaxID=2628915 RepID=UPI001DB4A100|nr:MULTISPECIES: DGQHR domain-containing protein [unclassified Pedobacter]CAH0137643.1 hypothetical protein SRABI126_00207 [Pedobacter sp. Bi126]CAH0220750.1 hypothetical protein SRABI36_02474 [Pedobacter sp. Bi36]
MNAESKFLDPIPAIPVKQGENEFYIFTINAKKLLSISYTSERTQNNRDGIQRGLRRDRLIKIGKYLQGETSGMPILPNTIIVSLSSDSYFKNGLLHIANKEFAEAFVIDGQHRLWSFSEEFSKKTDINIVVSAFIALGNEKKALIFKTINGEQTKINPSLVYDLIPMLREKDWVKFEDLRSQEIVSYFNTYENSPWAKKISMVGEPGKIISQSSLMAAIKKLFKKGHIFYSSGNVDDLYEAVIQENLLNEYFISVSDAYSVEWDNKDYLLSKYVGVSAILMLLELIVNDIRQNKSIVDEKGLNITSADFDPYIAKLRIYNFSAKDAKKEGKSYVGEGGVNELFKKISNIIFPQ